MMMKVLLLEDVDDLGRKGEVFSVKPGYAFNYLIPQQFGMIADKASLKRQARLREERRVKAQDDLKESENVASQLQGETVEITVKVDHEGHMYGSVSQLDVIQLIKLKTGITLDKKMVQLKHPIKEVGVKMIPIRLKESVEVEITLKVIPEAGE